MSCLDLKHFSIHLFMTLPLYAKGNRHEDEMKNKIKLKFNYLELTEISTRVTKTI